MVHGVVALTEGYGISQMILRELIGGKYLCDATNIIFRYIVYVGPWVKVPKALEEDTQMWVYGVSPCPWLMS